MKVSIFLVLRLSTHFVEARLQQLFQSLCLMENICAILWLASWFSLGNLSAFPDLSVSSNSLKQQRYLEHNMLWNPQTCSDSTRIRGPWVCEVYVSPDTNQVIGRLHIPTCFHNLPKYYLHLLHMQVPQKMVCLSRHKSVVCCWGSELCCTAQE